MTKSTATSVPRGAGDGSPPTERNVGNAPWRLWAWPYGLVVLAMLVLWYLIPTGWLWVPLAFIAGILVSLRTWSEVGRHGLDGRAR